jgi:hypothetical protein
MNSEVAEFSEKAVFMGGRDKPGHDDKYDGS